MPTKDLVTDFGGVGNGQRMTVTASITGGTKILTPAAGVAGPFGAGDVGKAIFITAASTGFSLPSNAAVATITAYNAGTGAITVSPNASSTQSSVSMDIVWGTDNTSAFMAFNAWAFTQTGQTILTIPAGHFVAVIDPFSMPNRYLPNVKWAGPFGAAATCKISGLTAGEMRFGGEPAVLQSGMTTGGNCVRLLTTTAGSHSATLVDPATFGSKVHTGRYCLIGGFDLQSYGAGTTGYPPNQMFYEWNYITAYNSGTGVATLQNALSTAYKSTWPIYTGDSAFSADQGGPATMWICDTDFDSTVELIDFTIDHPYYQTSCHVRDVIMRRIIQNSHGMYPTLCDTFLADTCNYSLELEIDKLVNDVQFVNCDLQGIKFQSSSPHTLTITGGTVRYISGCNQNVTLSNVTFLDDGFPTDGKIQVGAIAHGRTDTATFTNCANVKSFTRGGAATDDLGMAASSFYTMSGGILSFAKSTNDGTGGRENVTRCLAPGTWISFDDKYFDQVTDVYESAGTVYIQLKYAVGGWPFTPVNLIRVHPCPDFTMNGCTGTAPELEDWNQATDHIPLYSYSKRTYSGGPASGSAVGASPVLLGRVVTEKLNVTTAYTGAGALSFLDSQFLNRPYVKQSDYSGASDFGSYVDMKVLGERIVRAATTATGAQPNDGLKNMTAPGEAVFYGVGNSLPIFSANVTNGETPTLSVEYVMDHNIAASAPVATPSARLRMRLR